MKTALKYFLITGLIYALVIAAIDTLYLKKAFDIRKFIMDFVIFGLIMSWGFIYYEKKKMSK